MPVKVVFHRLAANEARAAEAWYARRSPEAAVRFRAAVQGAVQQVADDVATHAIGTTRFRYVRVRRFPYRRIYCFESNRTARVIAVSHGSRRPGYWRGRK